MSLKSVALLAKGLIAYGFGLQVCPRFPNALGHLPRGPLTAVHYLVS